MTTSDQERFATLKDEARGNVERIDPLGISIQAQTMRLYVQPGLDDMAREGVPDTRCGTCAFREGTVPGGCVQTQADALKAILEDVPFMCHAHEENGKFTHICHGWLAARVHTGLDAPVVKCPWPWSGSPEHEAMEREHAKRSA
jgi:hypothetical protein